MEPINTPLLNLVEAFGTRNQEQLLGDVVTPVWPATSDAFGNMRLVGADATSPLTPATAVGDVAVRVVEDTYVTGLWLVEPRTVTSSSIVVVDVFVQRLGETGAPFQIAPLLLRPFDANGQIGRASVSVRTYCLEGWPSGWLLRAGDLISCRYDNRDTAALVTGMVIAYRGFKGPPA